MAHTCTRMGSTLSRGIVKHKLGVVDYRDAQDIDCRNGGPKRLRKSILLHPGMFIAYLDPNGRQRAQEQARQRET